MHYPQKLQIFRPEVCIRSAEDEGFEPSVGHPTHAFQACALGRYANPPVLLEG